MKNDLALEKNILNKGLEIVRFVRVRSIYRKIQSLLAVFGNRELQKNFEKIKMKESVFSKIFTEGV